MQAPQHRSGRAQSTGQLLWTTTTIMQWSGKVQDSDAGGAVPGSLVMLNILAFFVAAAGTEEHHRIR